MKYQSSLTKQLYNIEFTKKTDICPECSHTRKKKKDKCLQFYQETNSAYCFNCNTTFFEYKPFEPKEYKVPVWKNITKLTDKAVKWFTSRMISQDTLNKLKIYSDTEYMPQFDKEINVICFPFFYNEKLKNIKYRGGNKSFKLYSGAELMFYNLDSINDKLEVIIVEGEIDLLSFVENGFDNVISVPNGANSNLEYLDNYIHLFDDIEKIYLATDNDTKGIELRDEFIRRFGAHRCNIVSFKECKDANQYFCTYGGIEFKKLLDNSKPVPIKGVVCANSMQSELYDFFKSGVQRGKEIGVNEIDKFITWETGRLAIVTGVPGCGKSEFIDFVVSKLNLIHGWKVAYFTPENYPLKYHYAKMYEKYIGSKFSKSDSNDIEFDMAYEHINDNIFWILNEDDLTIDTILENAKHFIKTKGIKVLVIDPYNKIDHQYEKGISETQYISKFLDKIITFGKFNNVLIILVAHPRKIEKGQTPTLYDISGSANFYNKTDYGIICERELNDKGLMSNDVLVYYKKIKYKNLGEQGISELRYNYKNGRFETRNNDVDHWDNSNWLINNNIDNNLGFVDECPF